MSKDGINMGTAGKAGPARDFSASRLFRDWGKDLVAGKFGGHQQPYDDGFATIPNLIPNQGIIQRQPYQPFQPFENPYAPMTSRLVRPSFMAKGGKVQKGKPYIVGEEGPELIVPDAHGTVVPAEETQKLVQADPRIAAERVAPTRPAPTPAATRLVRPDAQLPTNPQPIEMPTMPIEQNVMWQRPMQPLPAAPSTEPNPADAAPEIQQNAGQTQDDWRDRLVRDRAPSDDTWGKIEDLYQDKGVRDHSLKHRLSSFAKASDSWDGQGGILGWLAHTAFGGIKGTASPKAYDEMRRENDQRKLFRQLGPEMQREQWDTTQTNQQLQPYFKQQQVTIAQQKLQNQVQRDVLNFQAKIRIAEAKAAAEGGKWDVFVDEQTGRVMKRFKNDPSRQTEAFLDDNGKELISPTKQVYDYTSPSGAPVRVTGSEILKTDVGIATANAASGNTAAKFGADAENDYRRKIDEHTQKLGELAAKGNGAGLEATQAEAQLASLEAQIKTQGFVATGQQESQKAQLNAAIRSKHAEAKTYADQVEYLQKHPPTRPTTYEPQTVSAGGGGTFTEAYARGYYKKQGKSDAEIEDLVKKGKAQGLIH